MSKNKKVKDVVILGETIEMIRTSDHHEVFLTLIPVWICEMLYRTAVALAKKKEKSDVSEERINQDNRI